jgi:hypothetical protein
MTEITASELNDMAADESTEETGENPSVYVDYRVFEIEVQGGSGDTTEDVNEVMDERLRSALKDIEALKRTDFELDDEFDIDRSAAAPEGMMTQ